MRYSVVLIAICAVVVLAIPDHTDTAEAAPQTKKKIGIVIEKSCLLSDKCLNYSDIIHLDRSNKQVSGDFVLKDGDYARQCSKYQSSMAWYDVMQKDKLVLFVDPCFSQRTYIPTITIVSKLDHFESKSQKKITELKQSNDTKATYDTRSYSHTRYVDSKCNSATIGYSTNWKNILIDTINYLSHECHPDHTKITTNSTETRPLTKHKLSESYKWQHDKWLEQIKKECLQKRNSCQDLRQPV